ncbi:hypothetical protein D0Z03_001241 [Geotrichum reessii]|nr:hypothetical protein D0Z03_001241 [Galactomyces reessii]
MNGGLYCNENGEIEKPFPNRGYCADGTGGASAVNSCGDVVSFCQTVLPGNEAMIIPTEVSPGSSKIIAVPDPSYWVSTAAHYYINAPGVGATDGCVWGSKNKPIGNWSPYVAGANTDNNGNTFVKIAFFITITIFFFFFSTIFFFFSTIFFFFSTIFFFFSTIFFFLLFFHFFTYLLFFFICPYHIFDSNDLKCSFIKPSAKHIIAAHLIFYVGSTYYF